MKVNFARFVFAAVAIVLLLTAAPALSLPQDSAPPAEVTANEPGTSLGTLAETLGSITGIVALTAILVEIIKRSLARVPFVADMPIWLIAFVVGGGLAAAGNAAGYLPGNIVELFWQGAMAAAAASGLYSWIDHGSATPNSARLNRLAG